MSLPTLDLAFPAQGGAEPERLRSANDCPDAAGTRQPDSAAAAPLRILVVDDHADAADGFAALLQLGGHSCRVAHTGERALAMDETFQPDVAFVDIGLPGMDGHEVAQALRRRRGASVLLVALTGWGGDKARREALAQGFDLHLTKPADPRLIDQLLAREARRPAP